MPRLFILIVLSALLVACGGQPTAQTPAAGSASTPAAPSASSAAESAAPSPAESAVPSTAATTAPETATSVAQAETECAAGERLFDHELLASDPVCIPSAPTRILALDMASVEMTLLTDKTLVGTGNWILSELPLLHPPFAETLKTVEDVGYPANLEKVALLKPDVILAVGGTSAGETIDVEQAKQIAPLVFADPVIYNDWKLGMEFWSAVLNVPEVYTALEANYQARVGELQAALGDTRSREISVMAVSTYGISLWMPDTPPGAILTDVGLSRPESQRLTGDAATAAYGMAQYATISTERLDLADADAIYYFTYASSDAETASKEAAQLTSFEQQPVWKSLKAVQANQAFRVPEYWWRSQTYILANKVVDDLFSTLTSAKATTPMLEQVP